MTDTPERDAIVRSLRTERTVDIVTTGRTSGLLRTTEIWTTVLDGEVLICGTPNASQPGVVHQPRDWLANLLADPSLIVRLKASVVVDLPATAEQITDPAERRRIMGSDPCAWYREHGGDFEDVVAHSPIVRLTFTGDAAWLGEEVRRRA